MNVRPTIASARGIRKVIADFLVMDEDGVTHEITGNSTPEGLRVRTVCDYSERCSRSMPLRLAKGAVTCMSCLSTD